MQAQKGRAERSRRVEDERRLRRYLPDRNLEFPFLVADTHTYIQRERERERETEQKRENDSLRLPAVDHAKMIIMPESLQ